MSQTRLIDFGALRSFQFFLDLAKSFTKPSLLQGGQFSVAGPDQLQIAPSTVVMPSGVVIIEDEIKILQIPNTTNPLNYTIFYSHVPEKVLGGNKADLLVQTGLLKQEDITDSVILGYVQYPGFNVPLALDQFSGFNNASLSSQQTKDFPLNTTLPPFDTQLINGGGSGILTVTSLFESPVSFTRFRNNDTVQVNALRYLPGIIGPRPPRLLRLIARADFGASVAFSFIGSTGLEVIPQNNNINNTANFSTFDLLFPEMTTDFITNQPFNIKLDFNIGIGKQVDLAALGYSSYNLPF